MFMANGAATDTALTNRGTLPIVWRPDERGHRVVNTIYFSSRLPWAGVRPGPLKTSHL
jgi:hypothetical protein